MELKTIKYKDGYTVSDKKGNILFMQNTLFPKKDREDLNFVRFALGEFILDSYGPYGNQSIRVDKIKLIFETQNKNFIGKE